MKYKLVACDIDDTLLNSKGEVTPRVKEAIVRAREQGVIVTVATGRGFKGSKRIIDEIGVDTLTINYGGAQITDARTSEIVSVQSVGQQLVVEAVELAHSLSLYIQVYDGDEFVFEREGKWSDLYASFLGFKGRAVDDITKHEWNTPKLLCIDEPERIRELLPLFGERFEGRLKVSTSKANYIELNDLNSDKGVALEKLIGMLGVKKEETIAVGDNLIDLPMIEYAGLGVCVASGTESVKAKADYVAPGCDEDAVAHVLEKFVLNSF